jgi:hypothetical protein
VLTWRLWRRLNRRTPLTAVYYRLHLRRTFVEQQPLTLPGLTAIGSIAMMVLPVVLIFLGMPLLILAYIFLLPYAEPFLLLVTIGYGLLLCVSVSAQLAREHERGVYDLLCSCPPGRLGLHWAYAATWLSRHRSLLKFLMGILAVGSFALLLDTFRTLIHFGPLPLTDNSWRLVWFIFAIASIASLWMTYLQTLVMSSLAAILIGALVSQAMNARLYAVGLFLCLQAALYVLIGLMRSAFASGNAPYTVEQFIITEVIVLLIAFVLREGANWLLWQAIVRTLSASPSELDALMRGEL